jgi:queuine/archaeosine tRNA-ribosyltransferase
MAEAARQLYAMGYHYLAVGGMVPLRASEIMQCLGAIRETVPPQTKLHILGFAKADQIASFLPYGITSFDTTSPLIRAFKDAKSNYYLREPSGGLRYYTAIRVPQSIENRKLQNLVKQGRFRAEELTKLESGALRALREYDRTGIEIGPVLDAVMAYSAPLFLGLRWCDATASAELTLLRQRYQRTLEDRPWKKCACPICRAISIEVVIFRASNRNKRRGIHNLGVFKHLVDDLEKLEPNERIDLFSDTRSAVA